MSQPTFDLQSHSTLSDGALAPAEVVAAAAAAGVELLALSDHDSTLGVAQAVDAARAAGIGLVPATEITAILDGKQDLHVCGYLIDPDEPTLVSTLERSRNDRERRAEKMGTSLRELGFAIDAELLRRRTAEGKTIGRPHLAQAVVSHPDNRERLQRDGLLDPTEFLIAYLIEGKPAFAPRDAPTVEQAIELIHGAGGLAVWAHPFWDIKDPDEVIDTVDRFRRGGLDGVEAFYASHTEAETRLLVSHCDEHGLLTTGSSDFHGPDHPTFSRFRAFCLYDLEPNLGPIAGS
ncbi:MAG TPA: PHP domain-containing protein [Solirubrobacteraceae bacterium]|nr:PHP domain-containing protein [Solirubrobacteraceae bacterium]